jgi:large subunit ribosomal protein L4
VATLKKFNIAGEAVGTVEVNDSFLDAVANTQMIKDYIVALRANARQWSASTKGRSEVKHTTKKPHPQKKQGRARQGSLVAPQYRGGGVVFGPKPKFDQHIRINKKERRAVIRHLIAEKIADNSLIVLDDSHLESAKTKVVSQFIENLELTGRVLFLGEGNYIDLQLEDRVHRMSLPSDRHHHLELSLRNLQKASFKLAVNISGYDVLVAKSIVITEKAVDELSQWLVG